MQLVYRAGGERTEWRCVRSAATLERTAAVMTVFAVIDDGRADHRNRIH